MPPRAAVDLVAFATCRGGGRIYLASGLNQAVRDPRRPLRRDVRQVAAVEEFAEFAEATSPRLRRAAFLLCGDWHLAEDLAQTTLVKVFTAWRRVNRADAAYAYATRTLVNTYLADRRRKSAREVVTSQVPERAVSPQTPELRMVVMDALATLPPKARVVVVMRYWADMSVEQVADLLGCSTGNVKSQSARALDKLRALLEEPGSPQWHGVKENRHG
jgi:RNA polymerase sigma-70 factor (sigma-E family)